MPFLGKKKQNYAPFLKLIREIPYFETRFSQNQVKPYSGVFNEHIVAFLRSL